MKLSIYDKVKPKNWHRAMILLDDKQVSNCISADEENGTVIVYEDNDGYKVFNDGKFCTKTMHGKVEIILPK